MRRKINAWRPLFMTLNGDKCNLGMCYYIKFVSFTVVMENTSDLGVLKFSMRNIFFLLICFQHFVL